MRTFSFIPRIVVAGLALLAAGAVFGQSSLNFVTKPQYITKGGTASTSSVVYFAPGANPFQQRLVYMVGRSDTTTNVHYIYGGTAKSRQDETVAVGSTNFTLVSPTGFAATDVVLVWLPTTKLGYIHQLYSVSGTTGAVATYTTNTVEYPSTAEWYALEDRVEFTYPTANTDAQMVGEAVFSARRNMPIMITVTGTNSAQVKIASVKYDEVP